MNALLPRIAASCRAPNVLRLIILLLAATLVASPSLGRAAEIDFNRDIRPLLSNYCFKCHGPDEQERKGGTAGLRLDTAAGAQEDLGGYAAVVPGKPDESELLRRVVSEDEGERMPPVESGTKLSPSEIQLLRDWIAQGAAYARHWSYVPPQRPALPTVRQANWPRNAIDYFVLDRLEREGLTPSEEADRYALIRRVSLDLTGLPPTPSEVDAFVLDPAPDAYERLVDRLLGNKAYGEHSARMWLDLARYADSAGYADDPPRTIWAYRDYVIRSLNANKPFDQFTMEQIAGDLLPSPTSDQLIATAFHRNTLTNNEGGTNDEEFRNVAVVDRVNTTMAVWMGTTMACAQCHSHKYDPISQEEYFRFFAILNNTADADRQNESPLLDIYTDEQLENKARWQRELDQLQQQLVAPHPELAAGLQQWAADLASDPVWQGLVPQDAVSSSGAELKVAESGTVSAARGAATETYTVSAPLDAGRLAALQLEALPSAALPGGGAGHGGGNFVISRVTARLLAPGIQAVPARYVRVELPGPDKILSLAEVQVFADQQNVAPAGQATQSTTAYGGQAQRAIDGNTNGDYFAAQSTTHTESSTDPWWQVDLGDAKSIERVVVWNRTDNGLQSRLANFRVVLLGADQQPVWETTVAAAPMDQTALAIDRARPVPLAAALADHSQEGFSAADVLNNPDVATRGWAVGGQLTAPHRLTLVAAEPVEVDAGAVLEVRIEQLSQHEYHTLGQFRLASTADPRAALLAKTPAEIVQLARTPDRSEQQQRQLQQHYTQHVAPELQSVRERAAVLTKMLSDLKPATTVPIQRELSGDERRKTLVQHRGNFLDTGAEVEPGLPDAFHALPEGARADRLGLARWLVDDQNPLTSRVVANRYWEQIFGIGIVSTSEEFGSQGDPPSHPELLDWLATELEERDWDLKQLARLLVTSAAYRQSSRVTPQLYDRDPDNRLLARGPRFRLSAEAIRDQSLFVAGLLSSKMYGPPVKPPQPSLGLNAAFGSGIDWQTSEGEDRYRRGLYTTWRRSNPYPSMVSFDAPNREVCTIRRVRTNTPLQALVTLNDPVYVEAAQGLAERMMQGGADTAERIAFGFRLCLARPPQDAELQRLQSLFTEARERYLAAPDEARALAGRLADASAVAERVADAAAWTVLGNVLLNLDETLMKR